MTLLFVGIIVVGLLSCLAATLLAISGATLAAAFAAVLMAVLVVLFANYRYWVDWKPRNILTVKGDPTSVAAPMSGVTYRVYSYAWLPMRVWAVGIWRWQWNDAFYREARHDAETGKWTIDPRPNAPGIEYNPLRSSLELWRAMGRPSSEEMVARSRRVNGILRMKSGF
jgi:hypothetical protein